MLGAHPELNKIFNRANQAHHAQPRALAGALYAYASHIDDLGQLTPAVELMCHKHASLYVQPEQYEIVGKYLLGAMGKVLGDALTPEVLEAWTVAYWQLADVLINREQALYKAALVDSNNTWTTWRDFRIAKKILESDEVTSFYLEPTDGKKLPSFQPGQYISIQTNVPALGTVQSRQYSLSDAPHKTYLRISVKREDSLNSTIPGAERHPGYMSNLLHSSKAVGDVIKVSHPFGDFFISEEQQTSDKPLVMIGGGVGLTPLMTILNDQVARGAKRPISWIHSARTHGARAFTSHVSEIVNANSNIKSTLFTDSDAAANGTNGTNGAAPARQTNLPGELDLEKVSKEDDLFVNEPAAEYFVCGPTGFMLYASRKLQEMGVEKGRIHLELFGTGGVPAN